MTTEPILHHFELSPFSEKLRTIFGLKRLAWRSVLVPMAMPKPDVVALTGGYRKTPFLQIGADIYCDTALIAQVVDALAPTPPLFPASAAMAPAVAAWADGTVFWQAIMNTQSAQARAALFNGMAPEAVRQLRDDRAAFTAQARRPNVVDAQAQLQTTLQMAERALASQPWLLGAEPSVADFSVYHGLWFIGRAGMADALLAAYPAVLAWMARIAALGHGQRQEMSSAEAIALAAAATAHEPVQVQPGLGFQAGDRVTVSTPDYGPESVTATLVGLGMNRITLERSDPRAGTVHVHFPRNGFNLRKAD